MTPEQKVKWIIIRRVYEKANKLDDLPEVTKENVDSLFEETEYKCADRCGEGSFPYLCDVVDEVRNGENDTDLDTPSSRHYESKAVAARAPDDSFVGWTYWYGGGKHGQPESIDWINEAYDLDCKEEEKLVKVRKYTRK
jgi:hypothetical protein